MNVLGTLLRRREEQLPTATAANKHSNRMQLYINCIVSVFYICTFASVSVFEKQQNASPLPHIATDCIHAWIAESVTKCATRLNLLGSQSINARILCKWRQDCTFHTQRIVRSQIPQHSRRQVLKESKEWSAVAVNRIGTSPNQHLLFTPSFPEDDPGLQMLSNIQQISTPDISKDQTSHNDEDYPALLFRWI